MVDSPSSTRHLTHEYAALGSFTELYIIGIKVVSGQRLPFEQHTRSFDNDDTLSNEGSADESDGESDGGSDNEMTELGMRAQSLQSLLTDLYRLSFKIRNTNLRGNASKALAFKQFDEESGINIFSVYEELDRRHIHEYLSSIRQTEGIKKDLSVKDNVSQTANAQWPDLDENTITLLVKQPIKTFFNLENDIFARRLALANTHRRQFLAYWRRHALKLSNDHEGSLGTELPGPLGAIEAEDSLLSGQLLPVLNKPGLSPFSQIASTIISGTDATRFDPKNEDRLDTDTIISYATTACGIEGDAVGLPPPPPDAATKSEFLCQICHVVCPSKEGKRKEWR
jgi:hypothetical protein